MIWRSLCDVAGSINPKPSTGGSGSGIATAVAPVEAVAPIRSLAQGLPYAVGVAKNRVGARDRGSFIAKRMLAIN